MKKFITTLTIILSSLIITTSAMADHHGPQTSAIEMFQCSFANGRDMDDVKKVAAEWDQWGDGKFTDAYSAYIMQPIIYNGADFPIDYIWLGVAENHEAMGRIKDEWFAQGAKLQRKFDLVAPCSSNSLLTSVEVKPYSNIGGAGFLQVNACELNDGMSFSDLAAADNKWTNWMTENDMPVGAYRWINGVGDARTSTTDFYNVYIAESLADRGEAHDMMFNGGFQVAQTIYKGVMECDKPRVWMAQPVGTIKPM
ncbi:MAG: hypothetical protein HOM23_09445 [Porticoccaceae bacterium]|jgi:hypothetical protein|nr:hypothetical protein [Porticoccaceae bacterium]MBT6027377.1 hypothetical protein [Porticoccaceae bacterium]